MGSGAWDPGAWTTYSSTVKAKPTSAVFKSSSMVSDLDPKGVTMRESRDSVDNPESTAIICGLDVTGSMGEVARIMATEGLGTLFSEILDRKPVTNPHMMFMAIGDVWCDRSPLQVSQFEADSRVIEQLTKIYVEGGGGGNGFESYDVPWYFAGAHTSIDCFEKRGKKGYLFTVGDEPVAGADDVSLRQDQILEIFGDTVEDGLTPKQLLAMAERYYHVFHVILTDVGVAKHNLSKVRQTWEAVMPASQIIELSDYKALAEVIVSTIQVVEGADKATVAGSWSGGTALVVKDAIRSLTVGATKSAGKVKRF